MIEGHFIPTREGNIFLTSFSPENVHSKSAVMLLPSIFEEMNLSRAIVAKQAQFFASTGLSVFALDYLGTGDSELEINQVDVQRWLDNIIEAGRWILEKGFDSLYLWGVRFGGLLILANQQTLHAHLPIKRQLLWKPVTSGKLFVGQLLRLKQANSMMQGGVKVDWRQKIKNGEEVEVAGYPLTNTLLESIEQLDITELPASPVGWLELASQNLSPLIKRMIDPWPQDKIIIESVQCPAFWQVPEIFDLPQIRQISQSLLLGRE